MGDPLRDFLGKSEPENLGEGFSVSGTFACQECGEVTQEALLNYDDKLLKWVCSNKHTSQVTMDV